MNQPDFELSNSYNFLFRIIQVLKVKKKKEKEKNTQNPTHIRWTYLYLKSLCNTKKRGGKLMEIFHVIGPTATK